MMVWVMMASTGMRMKIVQVTFNLSCMTITQKKIKQELKTLPFNVYANPNQKPTN